MADPNASIDTLTNLGGTGAIVVAFLWYLNKRDTLMQESLNVFSSRLEKLADAIDALENRLEESVKGKRKRSL